MQRTVRIQIGIFFALLCLPLAALGAQDAKSQPFRGEPVRSHVSDTAIEQKIEALLKKMTVEEKVGQLAQYSSGTPTGPGRGRTDYPEMVAKGEVGSLFNIEGAQAANQYQHIAVDKSRLHIPLLFGLDVIHGFRTTLPVPLGLASTWDPQIVEKGARLAAEEASASGIRWTFSPMVDIARDPRWGRIIEGAGEDPYLGSVLARAYVRGYQGTKLDAPDSIAACPKHFVGYGAAEGGRDYNPAEISEHTLREDYLPPFYAALDEGAATIMSGFNSLNGVPASANPFTLTEILRNEWKFPGLAVSDWTSVSELINHGIALDGATAARKAFMAGVDMDMQSDVYHAHLADLVKSGQVSQARLDDAVRHVLRVKFALGLFEHPYTDEHRENSGALPATSVELARKAAERSFVLLKNDAVNARPILPLGKDVQTVALIGPLADDAGNMLGSWAGRGKAQDAVTLKSALVERLGADHVKYAKGGNIQNASAEQIDEAVAAASAANVVIMALGEDAGTMTAEAASRAYLDLPGQQEQLLERVAATGKPVVLILFSGRPLILPWAFQHVPAVLAAWFPGIQAGPALTRVLFGDVAPEGKLVMSWPRAVGQIPVYYNAQSTGRPAGDTDLTHPATDGVEKYVSRYIDVQNSPQFPFGYGLSYTDFAYSKPEISASKLGAKDLNSNLRKTEGKNAVLTVTAEVKNTGQFTTEEVVQLYVRLEGTSMAEPVRALKGFQRVALGPGESRKVTFSLGAEAFALWSIDNDWRVEPSRVHVWVSPDSARGEAAELQIAE
ncbi:MAG TPA: glycoside hydrolase family 3 N-terminal domain-containing protein [Candidatus Acidoferrum sp.]